MTRLWTSVGVAMVALPLARAARATGVPNGLLCDWRPSPSVGVSAEPSFSWVVPHLFRPHGCGLVGSAADDDETDQLQHSYQLQIAPIAAASATGLLQDILHDTHRTVDARANMVLATQPALEPGTTYTWRVRVWTSAAAGEGCVRQLRHHVWPMRAHFSAR